MLIFQNKILISGYENNYSDNFIKLDNTKSWNSEKNYDVQGVREKTPQLSDKEANLIEGLFVGHSINKNLNFFYLIWARKNIFMHLGTYSNRLIFSILF